MSVDFGPLIYLYIFTNLFGIFSNTFSICTRRLRIKLDVKSFLKKCQILNSSLPKFQKRNWLCIFFTIFTYSKSLDNFGSNYNFCFPFQIPKKSAKVSFLQTIQKFQNFDMTACKLGFHLFLF